MGCLFHKCLCMRETRALLSSGVRWASIVYSYCSYCNYYGCYFIEGHRTVKQLNPEHIMHHWEPILQLHSLEIIFHFVWDISWISDYCISFPWGKFLELLLQTSPPYVAKKQGRTFICTTFHYVTVLLLPWFLRWNYWSERLRFYFIN